MASDPHDARPREGVARSPDAHPSPLPPAERAPAPPPAEHHDAPAPAKRSGLVRWLVIGGGVLVAAGIGLFFFWPTLVAAFTTTWTDDAFVNGHVSFISARVPDTVVEVLVDDNQLVHEGDVLVRMDPEPYAVAVAIKKAALEVAEANVEQARATVRSQQAAARASWYSVVSAQEQLRLQVATLQHDVADLHLENANYDLAQKMYNRTRALFQKQSASQEDLDQAQANIAVARQKVSEAEQTIRKDRAALGLNPDAADPLDIPKDLEETYSAVQTALSAMAQSATQIGLPVQLYGLKPSEFHERLLDMDPTRDLNKTLERLVEVAPSVRLAAANKHQAEEDVKNAQLNLKYTTVFAPITGFVNKRSVNPGNQVQTGQALMNVRPLTEVWIDANFKETELADLRIGQRVDVTVDAYPGVTFDGRVAGFGAGTGSSTALLPPENATGNYVKVVQRLPVRIELTPESKSHLQDTPLFIGLSVVPTVRIKEPPDPHWPDAGRRLLTGRNDARTDK